MVVVHLGWVDSDLGSSTGWWAATAAIYCQIGGWNVANLSQPNPGARPPWSPCICMNIRVWDMTSVLTGRARLLGFRVGFRAQNPSLPLLRPSGFRLFQALGFFKLFQSFSIFFCSFENTLHLTSYKITHIEANSMNIGMRNDVPTCFSIKKEHNINFQHSL